jgi:hypothetical protein
VFFNFRVERLILLAIARFQRRAVCEKSGNEAGTSASAGSGCGDIPGPAAVHPFQIVCPELLEGDDVHCGASRQIAASIRPTARMRGLAAVDASAKLFSPGDP